MIHQSGFGEISVQGKLQKISKIRLPIIRTSILFERFQWNGENS